MRIPYTRQATYKSKLTVGRRKDVAVARPRGGMDWSGAMAKHVRRVARNDSKKTVLLQAWTGPEVSRKLRFPDFVTTAQEGGRLSALRTGHLYP